jgi:hypothetical protein
VWLRLLFKVLFMPKCIKMMFFHFLKIIFEISVSKRSKTYKKINFFAKKKLNFLGTRFAPRSYLIKPFSLLIFDLLYCTPQHKALASLSKLLTSIQQMTKYCSLTCTYIFSFPPRGHSFYINSINNVGIVSILNQSIMCINYICPFRLLTIFLNI